MLAFSFIVGADGFLECGPVRGSPRAVDPGIVYVLCELLQRLRSMSLKPLKHGLYFFFALYRLKLLSCCYGLITRNAFVCHS